MTNEEVKHYKVEAHIDGKWFKNDFVFESAETANSYGQNLVDNNIVEKYHLNETTDAVKLPET
jgi:hypothetical protein